MIEVHGWIVIRECYSQEQEELFNMDVILENVKLIINKLSKQTSMDVNLRSKNGIYQLSIFGSSNHYNSSYQEFFHFLEWLSKNAIGSYGLIHIHDDEDGENSENFYTYCLKKGKIYKGRDIYFSPINLEIEE